MVTSLEKEIALVRNIDSKVEIDAVNIVGNKQEPILLADSDSLELEKKKICDELHALYTSKRFDELKSNLLKLEKINNKILKILEDERVKLKTRKKVDASQIKSIKGDIKNNEAANKVIRGIIEVVPKVEKAEFKQYVNLGLLGLSDIRLLLKEVKGIDVIEIETIALVLSEFHDLQVNLKSQNKLAKRILKQLRLSVLRKRLRKKDTIGRFIFQLIQLIQKEIEQHNKVIKDIGYENKIVTKKQNDLSRVMWLEETQVKLMDDMSLLMNQFSLPRIVFPSGNFVTYTCSRKDAMQIISKGNIDRDEILPTSRRKFSVVYQIADLFYLAYDINKARSDSEFGFVFPLESVIHGKFFLADKLDEGELLVIDQPSNREILEKITARGKVFDLMIEDINNKFEKWVLNAEKINKRLKQFRTATAKKGISKNFPKKWLKDIEFQIELYPAYMTLLKIFEKEDLIRMNLPQLIHAVMKSKAYYKKMVKGADDFVNGTGVCQNIIDGVFFAPREEVLYWERLFVKLGYRPNTLYYDESNIRDAIPKRWTECKSNIKDKELPEAKEVNIIDIETNNALACLD